jgi:hypothetical protein
MVTSAASRAPPQSAPVAAHAVVCPLPPALGSATAPSPVLPVPLELEHAHADSAATPPAPASPTTPKAKRKRKRVGKVLVSGLTNLTAGQSASHNMHLCRCAVKCENHKAFEPAHIRQVQALSQSAKTAADKERYLMSHTGLVEYDDKAFRRSPFLNNFAGYGPICEAAFISLLGAGYGHNCLTNLRRKLREGREGRGAVRERDIVDDGNVPVAARAVRDFMATFEAKHCVPVGGTDVDGKPTRLMCGGNWDWQKTHRYYQMWLAKERPELQGSDAANLTTPYFMRLAEASGVTSAKVHFTPSHEQKCCDLCFVLMEFVSPTLAPELQATEQERVTAKAIYTEHRRLADCERTLSDARSKRAESISNDLVLEFDGAQSLSAIFSPSRLASILKIEAPVSWPFVSSLNRSRKRKRIVTALMEYTKGADFLCTLVHSEVCMMLRSHVVLSDTQLPSVQHRTGARRFVLLDNV